MLAVSRTSLEASPLKSPIFENTAPPPRIRTVAMRQVLCPRLIGRDEELSEIGAALEAARDGHGGTLFLLGEAGVGKSRLAREAERVARGRGLLAVGGRGVESGAVGSVSFRPI